MFYFIFIYYMSPNLAIKLSSAGMFTLGLLSLFLFNNVIGGLLIIYSIVNLSTLFNKGNKPVKFYILKINFVLSVLLFLITTMLIRLQPINSFPQLIIVIPMITIVIFFNYLAIAKYKFKN